MSRLSFALVLVVGILAGGLGVSLLDRGPEPAWPALAAAAFFAVCALGFAFGAILAPSANLTHVEAGR